MQQQVGSIGVWASQLALRPAAEVRSAAARIEELGYGTIWVGEADGREALTHAGLLLASTERITVATGIANLWARDAQAMINAARTLGEAYGGRFVLGIGASHTPLVARRGHDYRKPYSATVTYLDAMDRATYTSPAPTHDPDRVLAALGPKMLALARDRADGAHTFFVPTAHTRRAREILGDGPLLAPEQALVVARDRDEARELAGSHVAKYLDLPNYRRNLERFDYGRQDTATGGSDRLFDDLIGWGGIDDLAARVREQQEAGADHVAAHVLTESAERLPLDELTKLAEALGLTA